MRPRSWQIVRHARYVIHILSRFVWNIKQLIKWTTNTSIDRVDVDCQLDLLINLVLWCSFTILDNWYSGVMTATHWLNTRYIFPRVSQIFVKNVWKILSTSKHHLFTAHFNKNWNSRNNYDNSSVGYEV